MCITQERYVHHSNLNLRLHSVDRASETEAWIGKNQGIERKAMMTGLLTESAGGKVTQSWHNHRNSEKANLMMLAMHKRLSVHMEKVHSYWPCFLQ